MTSLLQWRVVGDNDAVSSLIKGVTRGPVSHVEFITDGGLYTIGARADGGVLRRPIGYAKFALELRFQAACTDVQYAAAVAFLQAQLGKPYDYLDVLGILADRDWHSPDSWICSELWAATMEAGGLIGALDSAIALFTPEEALVLSSGMPQFQRVSTP